MKRRHSESHHDSGEQGLGTKGSKLKVDQAVGNPTASNDSVEKPLSDSEDDLQVSDEEDDPASFEELLYNLNPFMSWEAQRDGIANDSRYLALDSNEKRASAFAVWAAKARQVESGNGLERYAALVQEKYRPNRFYLEFRRKFFKDDRFTACQLKDKEKERLYREYSRLFKKTPNERAEILKKLDAEDTILKFFPKN